MNDLNGRLDEIRRRSEALKEKQRKRKKLMLAILPLCLCLVLGLSLLPGLSPSAKDSVDPGYWPERGEPMGPLIPEQSASTTLSVVRIEITGNGLDRMVSEPGIIRDICKILVPVKGSSANMETAAPVGGTGDVYDGITIVIPSETESETEPYTLALTDAEGAVQYFNLQGNELTEVSTGKTRELTASSFNTLYQLLGFPTE